MEINHIKNVQEIVDRLVANNFECEYDQIKTNEWLRN